MKKYIALLFVFTIIYSCIHKQQPYRSGSFAPKVVEAKGYIVPVDSISQPNVIPVNETKLKSISAGKPTLITTNTNIHIAGIPQTLAEGVPQIYTPGKDTFALPQIVTAVDSPVLAGSPQVVIAKDAAVKDQNPQNFSSYNKLQGLKQSITTCMLQDRSRNIWFGTNGGGVSKFDGKTFSHYTENEGLGDNRVYRIYEDRLGNIWFATIGGVTKYDGINFTHYGEKEGLKSYSVFSIIEDKEGNLWFGSYGSGVSKFNGKTFANYSEKEGFCNSPVLCMLKDRESNLWFGTIGGGAYKFDGKSFFHFTTKEGLSSDAVYSMLEDSKGNIWFGTDGAGASKYDRKTFTNFTTDEGLNNNSILNIHEDKLGNIWFATFGGGISKYDGKNFTHFKEEQGLCNNIVYCILEDRCSNLWFGTDGGVSKYDGKIFTHFTQKEGLNSNTVYGIVGDKNTNLWFATDDGIANYDGKNFIRFTEKQGLINTVVFSIVLDKTGNLWFATSGGGVAKFDGSRFIFLTEEQGLANNVVYNISIDKKGNLWFGTGGGGVSMYDGKSFTNYTVKEGLSDDYVYTSVEDKNGNIWFGTNNGVTKFDGNHFTHFTEKNGLSNNVVFSIAEDKNGALWFGTGGGGINKYDGKSFVQFTEKEGLSNNSVTSILEDKIGNLWLGTRNGLSKLSKNTLEEITEKVKSGKINESEVFFKNYTYEDGFLGIGCNRNSIFEASDGTIYIGANDRLTAFHPEGDATDTIPPNIQITDIELFNENISWRDLKNNKDSTLILGNGVKVGKIQFDGLSKWNALPENLSLAYNNNYITFNFIGITQKSPKKVKYQYKLIGNDENWSAVTYRTEAQYGNLSHGSYTFVIKAMNSEGYWSNEARYTFSIRPPWWKTWWFQFIFGFCVLLALYTVYLWRTASLRKDKATLEKTVLERTAEVVAQKERSEDLLLNILPSEVAEELKQKGSAAAKQFDEVTVMFTDFKNFTQISEKLSPSELVAEIHTYFKEFDNIVTKHNIEKIKTIGDSYMCAGGLPLVNRTNAIDVVNAALEIQEFIQEQLQKKIQENKVHFEIRIGVHTGPVVAGIVGVKKFAYDIWGDTVNIASHMESSGEPGKVNISGSTYALVHDQFNCIHRGKIKAKHKGEIDMYFVERKS